MKLRSYCLRKRSKQQVSVHTTLHTQPHTPTHTITHNHPPQTMNKVVFIKEPVTEDSANNLMALTLYLDSVDQKRIYYWLNCPGGEVVPTLAL